MIRRLLEAHYAQHVHIPNPEQIDFWFREMRTPAILIESARRYPGESAAAGIRRRLVLLAWAATREKLTAALDAEEKLTAALVAEEKLEREADRRYWLPLRIELEELRHRRVLEKRRDG